jgi:Fe-S-cluster-containing hydrogenase component 2
LCGICEKLCPIGALEIFEEIVYVCDLCGGKPKCVEACTEGAISYEHMYRDKPPALSAVAKKTKGRNPSQKRRVYLESQGAKILKKWRERDA